ncbi:uncharacterized protein F4812DRAFT_470320 [Daldinia caldariorum]|uniref:uncharacterized protein n=1 Tax=Daldinia caldariorum TaxID=326644 RepID=UPI0020077898|nr:uncharacterized protein F4812DRAFT_470320 [Daldinia caldariorum]KAI1469308.1 hypothetical protein F4812DRAFT_470320 [Daldinia caldariorum]
MSFPSFPKFPKFPAEVQDKIWKAYILEANKSRLVLMDNTTKCIMPTKSLTSPALYTCVSSRKAYLDMYHVKLPVFTAFKEPIFLEDIDSDSEDLDTQSEDSFVPDSRVPVGYIYINLDRDIFLLSCFCRDDFNLGKLKLADNQRTTILFESACLPAWRRNLMKHFMEVKVRSRKGTPRRISNLVDDNDHDFSSKEYSLRQTCRHIYLFSNRCHHQTPLDDCHSRRLFLDDLMTLSGEEVLKKWDSHSFLYEGIMLRQSSWADM